MERTYRSRDILLYALLNGHSNRYSCGAHSWRSVEVEASRHREARELTQFSCATSLTVQESPRGRAWHGILKTSCTSEHASGFALWIVLIFDVKERSGRWALGRLDF